MDGEKLAEAADGIPMVKGGMPRMAARRSADGGSGRRRGIGARYERGERP